MATQFGCSDRFRLARRCYNRSVTRPSSTRAAEAHVSHSVPLLDLRRQYEQIREEVLAAIERVCASQQYILGPEVEAFEHEIAAFCGTKDAVGCSSGTDALWLALAAVGIQPGDQVITSPFSFFASASAIVRAGARPVFVDIDPDTFNLDAKQVQNLLRDEKPGKVRAILPVHLYGQCSEMDALSILAEQFELALIEDAAQAIGASYRTSGNNREQRAGSMGLAAAFSFYPTKNLSAYGEAGLVTTSNPDLAVHLRRLRNHGSPRRYLHEEFGWNSRLDAMQAAILSVKLKYVNDWNNARRQRAAIYGRMFADAGLGRLHTASLPREHQVAESESKLAAHSSELSSTHPIQLPSCSPHAHHVFHQYVIRAHRRDELRSFLAERKIGTEVYYPIPLHLQPCFAYLGYREGNFPQAERATKEVLALPMFPELTEDEQRVVVRSVADFYG
ncbi:MAG TPA: DegT/DnrJ/EryC1/StrS family aminotransferase [Candidatus Sulfotelmatobacter sp.]|nr:DegT/DnrJ/EryC1/StrS family aminotransferase [Candidatus Sulfotelmatobacter sp.]